MNVQPLEQVGNVPPPEEQTLARALQTPRIEIAMLDPEDVKLERRDKREHERWKLLKREEEKEQAARARLEKMERVKREIDADEKKAPGR